MRRPLIAAAGAAWLAAGLAAGLAGCGETDQSMRADTTNRSDVAAWEGTKNGYATQGWKAGDKASWERQIRARGQQQNEYGKSN